MELLERESQLRQLSDAFDGLIATGTGTCVLVVGEAGVGKTSLVRRFLEVRRGQADVFWGACEALFTPRPLGPIGDIAALLPPGLAAQVHTGNAYNGLFPAFLAFLREHLRPAVLVIEDAHWADEATLDFIKYLGRRIDSTRALLVVTLRDDELGLDHPLRRVLGDLPAAATARVPLAPLSQRAVAQLARATDRDAIALHRLTGGNPLYVNELLAAPGQRVPASVRDAVLSRFARLGAAAQQIVQLVAIEPGRLERAVVDEAVADAGDAVREATGSGMLRAEAGWLSFRHEIARQCIEAELPSDRRTALHAQVLHLIRDKGVVRAGLAREVHHAIGAERHDDVAALAPRAAAQAADLGSHREAVALYRRALAAHTSIDMEVRASLLEAAAGESHKTGALQGAIDLRLQALALRRAAGDRQLEGTNLRLLGMLHRQWSGNKAEYLRFASAAVEVLEPLGPSGELAKAYACLSHVHCLLSNYDEAIDWGARAVQLAQVSSDSAALAWALNRHGTAQLYKTNDADARAQLEQALVLAIDGKFEDLVAEIFISLQTSAIIHHDHAFALEVGSRALAYCEARDFDGYAISLRCRCAYSLLSLGRWDEGEQQYAQCAAAPNASALVRATCEYALRRQQVRRGSVPTAARGLTAIDGDVDDFWRDVQTQLHTLQVEFKAPAIAATCVEAAWLRGDHATALELAHTGLADALATRDGRLAGPLLVWLARLGVASAPFAEPLSPACEYELTGDRAAAAAEWERLSSPYECALVLAFGDAEQMRSALARFTTLGAERAAAITRNRMRALGVRGIERGPYTHARHHSVGFTRRENEVAELLCQGLSNSAIAGRLHRSERTIEHHVANVLAKLAVASRAQAVLKLSNILQSAEN